ncbi:MAG: L,D-transpeptidase family protein [Bacteroidota bacterium]
MIPSFSLHLSVLLLLTGWGFLSGWFDEGAQPADLGQVQSRIEPLMDQPLRVAGGLADAHSELATLYSDRDHAPLWTTVSARAALESVLRAAPGDGLRPTEVHAPTIAALIRQLEAAEIEWASHTDAARDTLSDPRPALLARLDVVLTDGLLRYGDAVLGARVDAAALYPGTWFPTQRDSLGTRAAAFHDALATGNAQSARTALADLHPPHAEYHRLRSRLAALLRADLAPIPEGIALRPGGRSIRVPHLRDRLDALGFLPTDTLASGWQAPNPYVFDSTLAAGLARFQAANALDADSVLSTTATMALNRDPDSLRTEIALNLERWRWLPDDLGNHFIRVNLPAFELTIHQLEDDGYAQRMTMPVNIGNAQTTGWTTPVITDSVHTIEFQPAWYVPTSLKYSNILPMALADSLSLWRQGIDTFLHGAAVDSRLVKWDSVDVSGYSFVQRPGPANPLGRVKFMMTNPYAILIHDTNKPSLRDGRGSAMSSGCVQAGAPEDLAEYLMTRINGWEAGRARSLYRRGPRQAARLDVPMRSHFVYFTIEAPAEGGLRLHPDPYGYEEALAAALKARQPGEPRTHTAQRAGEPDSEHG